VHVKGVVAIRDKGKICSLKMPAADCRSKPAGPIPLLLVRLSKPLGFLLSRIFFPVLEDAIIRKTTETRADLLPKPATIAELQKGLHHSDFVTLRGRLIDRLVKGVGQTAGKPNVRTTLVLKARISIFVAEKDTTDQNSVLTAIPVGSLVEVNGICLLESGDDGKSNPSACCFQLRTMCASSKSRAG